MSTECKRGFKGVRARLHSDGTFLCSRLAFFTLAGIYDTIDMKREIEPIYVVFETEARDVEYASSGELSTINRFFIEDIGPIGVAV